MPRKTKKSAAETTQTPPSEPPTCDGCGHELTWRDRRYVPAPQKPEDGADDWTPPPPRCKRCAQRNWHARLGIGAFHPATRTITQTGDTKATGKQQTIEVAVTANRAALRQQARQARFPLPPLQKTRRPTRAERRAVARAKVGAKETVKAVA